MVLDRACFLRCWLCGSLANASSSSLCTYLEVELEASLSLLGPSMGSSDLQDLRTLSELGVGWGENGL